MEYIISLLEGIITFISVYAADAAYLYFILFGNGKPPEIEKNKALKNAIGFRPRFYRRIYYSGSIFGNNRQVPAYLQQNVQCSIRNYNYLIWFKFYRYFEIPFISNQIQHNKIIGIKGFFSSVLFGIIFSVSGTARRAFLGSALMLAAQGGETLKGILMLLSFSLGLGIPFIVSAVLIERLKTTFDFIKKNYRIINIISGGLLVIIGILMATGLIGYFFSILTF